MKQTAQKTAERKTDAKYLNLAGDPKKHQTESLYDYISMQLNPLQSLLYKVADRERDEVGFLLDVAIPLLKNAETSIYKALDVIGDNIGYIQLDVDEKGLYFDGDILGATLKPADKK